MSQAPAEGRGGHGTGRAEAAPRSPAGLVHAADTHFVFVFIIFFFLRNNFF